MKPIDKLKSLLDTEYESEDGDQYKIELLDGFTDAELEEYKELLPEKHLPDEITELLKFARGFEFYSLEEVRFDTYSQFGFEELFPNSIPLAGDGFGNFWVLDIDLNGHWKEVYYVCHDPAVVVKHSEDLTDFIEHIDDFGKNKGESHLDIIHQSIVMDIWDSKPSLIECDKNVHQFSNINENELPELFTINDLTHKSIKAGFIWGKDWSNLKIIRDGDNAVWVVEKKRKRSFLRNLFTR